jgi:hypothetical protein
MNKTRFDAANIMLLVTVAKALKSGHITLDEFGLISELMAELLEVHKVATDIVREATALTGKKETVN